MPLTCEIYLTTWTLSIDCLPHDHMTGWELWFVAAANHQRRIPVGISPLWEKIENSKLEVQFLLNLPCCYII